MATYLDALDLHTTGSKRQNISHSDWIHRSLDLAQSQVTRDFGIKPDEIAYVGMHGTTMGYLASLHAGFDPNRTGQNFRGTSQYIASGFYVTNDLKEATSFAHNSSNRAPAHYTSEQRRPVVIDVFLPRHLLEIAEVAGKIEELGTEEFSRGAFKWHRDGNWTDRPLGDRPIAVRGIITGHSGYQCFFPAKVAQWLKFGNDARLV